MTEQVIKIKRALLSVSDKTGIVMLAAALKELNIEILSTGGTAQCLRDAKIDVVDVSTFTQFPEMMEGRVKTLHPKIFAGILGKRDEHHDQAAKHRIEWIDLVVCNLYPFAQAIQKPGATGQQAIENIDVGGPSMVRAAAKNFAWTGTVVDVKDYGHIIDELSALGGLRLETRKTLAAKAFSHTANYDALIASYLQVEDFPMEISLPFQRHEILRYGENPHQKACSYQSPLATFGILQAKQLQGKELSYNNTLDADSALNTLLEFQQPACVIIKHATPCGVAINDTIDQAFENAWAADAKSAFGGIIALNRSCSENLAKRLSEFFIEVVIAPAYTDSALKILAAKPNVRVLLLPAIPSIISGWQYRSITGGLLLQSTDSSRINLNDLSCVTQKTPTENELKTMQFAWSVVKHIKSNGILIAKNCVTVGVGAGQVSRIDSVDLAILKAGNSLQGSVLASDAFFPFRDSIDRIAETPIRAIIQPGGSRRDDEVVAACNEHGIAMVLTGMRCFKH